MKEKITITENRQKTDKKIRETVYFMYYVPSLWNGWLVQSKPNSSPDSSSPSSPHSLQYRGTPLSNASSSRSVFLLWYEYYVNTYPIFKHSYYFLLLHWLLLSPPPHRGTPISSSFQVFYHLILTQLSIYCFLV